MKKRENYGPWWRFALPPLIVVALLSVVFAIRGVFPFGEGSIAYFDLADQFIPQYYLICTMFSMGKAPSSLAGTPLWESTWPA